MTEFTGDMKYWKMLQSLVSKPEPELRRKITWILAREIQNIQVVSFLKSLYFEFAAVSIFAMKRINWFIEK